MLGTASLAGVLYGAVQIVAQRTNTTEQQYALFVALMDWLGQLAIPSLGLQTAFAQQAALAQTDSQRRELASTARRVLAGLSVIWLAIAALSLLFQRKVLTAYNVTSPAAVWITVATALPMLVQPVFYGILQGRQNFLWIGWANLANSAGRLITVAIIVLLLNGQTVGIMLGVFAGTLTAMLMLMVQARKDCRGPGATVKWGAWLRRVVPVTLGLGAPTYMFTQDIIAVQRYIVSDANNSYGAARVVGRALVFIIIPLTAVMFARLVRSEARAENTGVARQAFAVSAGGGMIAAIVCTLFPELPLRVLSPREYWTAAWLVPWFAWGMLPLALSYVLVNNLLAKERYAAVPVLVMLAIGYGVSLSLRHESYLQVVQTFCFFSSLLFITCLGFTWHANRGSTKITQQVALPNA
jgi:O-antigen/teichoic acid export membrane protein